jgi:predicted enzyme involved in methoxymalonyl-ACP biosynthesis
MMAALYSDLSWLPPAPPDFISLCRSALDNPEDLGKRLKFLASHALDENQLVRLSKVISKARESGLSLAPLFPYRLGLISNSTLDFVVPALVGSAARHGIALECVKGAYDQAIQESLNPNSALYESSLNAVLLAIDWRGLPMRSSPGTTEEADAAINQATGYLRLIRQGIQQNSSATCIFQTLAAPP